MEIIGHASCWLVFQCLSWVLITNLFSRSLRSLAPQPMAALLWPLRYNYSRMSLWLTLK